MKILAINGSPRRSGNTATLIKEACKSLPEDAEVEILHLRDYKIEGCRGCEGCAKTRKCIIKDDMQLIYPKIEGADGLILGSPTYFYNMTSAMKAFIERLYQYELFDPEDRHVWASVFELTGLKYAAVVAVCEQLDEKDMGFTAEAMAMSLESLGYRVVEKVKVLNLFGPNEAQTSDSNLEKVRHGVDKLYKTINLAEASKS